MPVIKTGFGKVKDVDSSELPTYRKLKTRRGFKTTKDFIELIRSTGRDCTVQRESVWRHIDGKQSSYMSAVAHGYSDTSVFHLVNLLDTVTYLRPLAYNSGNRRDMQFVDHLQSFIDSGNTHIHVDGGNRSDTLIDWYDNKVALEPGNYLIGEGDDIKRVTLAKTNYYGYEKLMELGGEFAELAEHIDNQVFAYIEYLDLNREERADLFRKLNDNENLNTEELRNCSTADICGWIRELNYKHKDTFNLATDPTSFVTATNSIRYKFCAWLASLNNFYTYHGSVDAWSPKNLDADYVAGSQAENSYPEFEKFFESVYVPLVKTIGTFKNLGGSRNRIIDLWIVLVKVYSEGGELVRGEDRKPKYQQLLECYRSWISPYWADLTPKYDTGQNGRVNMTKFEDLYGANTHYKLKHRIPLLENEFIPLLKEMNLVVQKDPVRYAPSEWRLPLWYKQNGVCPLSGEVIPIEWATDGDKTNLDHIVPHSKGGTTTMDNVQLTLQEANAAKSDKG